MQRKFLAVVVMTLMFGAVAALSACNTVAGAGKDIQAGGAAIKDEANEHK